MAGYDDVLDSGAVDFDGAFDWYAAVEEIQPVHLVEAVVGPVESVDWLKNFNNITINLISTVQYI